MNNTGLTPREMEVALLMCRGLTNKQIATRLFLSIDTVATYRTLIYRKTRARNACSLGFLISSKVGASQRKNIIMEMGRASY